MHNPDRPDLYAAPVGEQLPEFIDQHRDMILASLDGLT